MTEENASADLRRIDRMMREKGIFTDEKTGRKYFSGYHYATLYDWDQLFDGITQLYLGWGTERIRSGILVFLDSERENGFIPRSNIGGREQLTEHAKPFLAQTALLCWKKDGQLDFLNEKYYLRLKKYLLCWLTEHTDPAYGLAFWDSAPHTGMDNQHARAGWWFSRFCLGADLASYLIRECRAFSLVARLTDHAADAPVFEAHAERIRAAMQKYLWNEKDGIFYDLDRRTGKPIKVKYIASFAALWAHAAEPEQARRLAEEHLQNPREFLRPFPFPALSADSEGYTEQKLPGDLGCGWRAQTWVPTNYMVFHGLMDYGQRDFAAQIAEQTLENVKRAGDREYYNTESRTGCGENPFWGWTMAAYFMPFEARTGRDPSRVSAGPDDTGAVSVP